MAGARGSVYNEWRLAVQTSSEEYGLFREMWWEVSVQTLRLGCQAGRCQTLGQKACSGRSRQCHLLHMSFLVCSQYWGMQHLGPHPAHINAVSCCQTWCTLIGICCFYCSSAQCVCTVSETQKKCRQLNSRAAWLRSNYNVRGLQARVICNKMKGSDLQHQDYAKLCFSWG